MSNLYKLSIEAASNGWIVHAWHNGFGASTRIATSDSDMLAEVAAALIPKQEERLWRSLRVDHPAQNPGVNLTGRRAPGDVVTAEQGTDPGFAVLQGNQGSGNPAGRLDAGSGNLGGLGGHGTSSVAVAHGSMPQPATPVESPSAPPPQPSIL